MLILVPIYKLRAEIFIYILRLLSEFYLKLFFNETLSTKYLIKILQRHSVYF